MKKIVLYLILTFTTLNSIANEGAGNQHLSIDLGLINQTLAINFKNNSDWHTYWKNPGDAGLPIKAVFSDAGKEIKLAEKEWPAPQKYLEDGGILTYGYEGEYSLFFDLPNKDIKNGKIQITFLICKDICIQGRKEIFFSYLNKKLTSEHVGTHSSEILLNRFNNLPRISNDQQKIQFYLNNGEKENSLLLHYEIKNINNFDKKMAFVFPFINPPFGQKKEELYYDSKTKIVYGVLPIEWEGEYVEPTIDFPKNGKFKSPINAKYLVTLPGEKPFVIEQKFSSFSLSDPKTLKGFFLSIDDQNSKESLTGKIESKSIWSYLFLALLGGMILNLMPCVLPVISIKLFGMIQHSHLPRKEILKQNSMYTLGILSTLWALGLILIILQKSGEVVGWGFQLQSPLFVFSMILFLFIFALNLFGLFEFATPGGKTLGGKHGGPFLSGIISVILSTPCSAPFLGTALGFAFTSGPLTIFLIFTFIGLGLASPFLATALIPSSVKFLPRPGVWMEKLKYFLGLALLITTIWLTDIFLGLTEPKSGTTVLLIQLVTVFFSLFAIKKITNSPILKIFFLITPIALYTFFAFNSQSYFAPKSKEIKMNTSSLWEDWTEEKLNEFKGKPIFIDFTADWCLTCKVNKKLVLDTNDFSQFAKENQLKLLRADWTNRDDKIGNWLAKFQVVGIPAYFLQFPNGEIKYLGETISISKIKNELKI